MSFHRPLSQLTPAFSQLFGPPASLPRSEAEDSGRSETAFLDCWSQELDDDRCAPYRGGGRQLTELQLNWQALGAVSRVL